MSVAIKRIQKEIYDMAHADNNDIPSNISANPTEHNGIQNLMNWDAVIFGAKDTPYENGIFRLKIILPNNYPFSAPNVKFTTKIFHPNIHENGEICLDILKFNWKPVYTISQVLLSIVSLLSDPNPNDPLNTEAAKIYKANKNEYNMKVMSYVQMYATK